jgi:GAF domain-containing protein
VVDQERLTSVLIEFARTLLNAYEVDDVLYRFCDQVSEVLPVDGAGVMLNDEVGHLRFVAASDRIVQEIEALQIELGEGPCLAAYEFGEQVIVADLSRDPRFPKFGPRAQRAGLETVHSFPMHAGGQRVGALNVYQATRGTFSEADQLAGQILADVATTYILNARAYEQSSRLAGQLQNALDTRVVIEQAKGRVAEQLRTDMGTAFELMRKHARSQGRRLHDVAAEVVDGRLRFSGGGRPM